MIHLIGFSLSRRFKNKMTFFLIIVLLIICLFIGFCDILIEGMKPDLFDPLKIALNVRNTELFELGEDLVIKEKAQIQISEKDDGYEILTQHELALEEELVLFTAIETYHRNIKSHELNEEVLILVNEMSYPRIDVTVESENTNRDHDMLFVFITGIYFMMIGFAALIAQEIVAEKTTNILELIGISISLKTHYYSKIVIGWLSVLLQIVMGLCLAGIVVVVRFLYDDGKGLIAFFKKLNLMTIEQESISEMVKMIFDNQEMIQLLLLSLVFLFIGILFIQMTLVLLTTSVQTIEEAGSIQSPFYIVLLVLYYVCMFLNNPESMTKGLGYLFSFVPVLSMIFMPSRLLIYAPGTLEVIVSFVCSLMALIVLIKWGEKRYVETVLDFSKNSQSPLPRG